MKTVRIPYIYILTFFLTGLAIAFSFLLWFRQLIVTTGTHTVAKGSILLTALLCTAIGSYLAGVFSEKTERPLQFASLLTAITGVFFVFCPLFLKSITLWFENFSQSHHPGPLATGFFRFGISFIAFAIPAAFTGCIFPLVSKYFIPQLNLIGRFTSACILSLATGMLTGKLLALYLFVPAIGINGTLVFSGSVFLATAGILFAYIYNSKKRPRQQPVSVSPIPIATTLLRFRKKKYVPETGIKLTRAILRVFALEGFGIAAILMTGQRILAQYSIMKPVFFNTHLFIIVFTGLIIGAMLYRPLLEKPANKHMSFATLRIISGLAILLSYLLLNLFPENITERYVESASFAGNVLVHSAVFATLMFVPTVLLGLSIPLAFRTYPRRVRHIGSNLGQMMAVLLMGITLGTLLVVLIIIPMLGLHYTIILTATLIVLSGVYLLYKDSRLKRAFRVGYALLVFLLLISSLGLLQVKKENQKDTATLKKREGMSVSVLARYAQNGEKAVYNQGHCAYSTDNKSISIQQAAALIPKLLNPQISSAIITGFGTGITAAKLEMLGVNQIHIAEPYGEIIKVSDEVFTNENNDIMTSSRVELSIEDPCSFLTRSLSKVDLITQGRNLLYDTPGMFHEEYFMQCSNLLTNNGILCQLIPLGMLNDSELKSIVNACSGNFATTTLWLASKDYALLIATREPLIVHFCALRDSFAKLNSTFLQFSHEYPDVESFLSRFLMIQLPPVQQERPNTHNKPFLEFNPVIPMYIKSSLSFLLQQQPGIHGWLSFAYNCEAVPDETVSEINRLNTSMKEQLSANTKEVSSQ